MIWFAEASNMTRARWTFFVTKSIINEYDQVISTSTSAVAAYGPDAVVAALFVHRAAHLAWGKPGQARAFVADLCWGTGAVGRAVPGGVAQWGENGLISRLLLKGVLLPAVAHAGHARWAGVE